MSGVFLRILRNFSDGFFTEHLQATPFAEAVARMCSVKQVFLEISQNSQENTCARDSFLIELQAFFLPQDLRKLGNIGKISKLYRIVVL